MKKLFALLRPMKVLSQMGYFNSILKGKPLNNKNEPLAWITYPALQFLNGLDLKGKNIYEYGSGNSTLYWANLGANVYSVEDNKTWFEFLKKKTENMKNINISLEINKIDFIQNIKKHDMKFDIILIDGEHSRYECAKISLNYLHENGVIILDNSDHYHNSAKFLSSQGLIQIDMSGFVPGSSAVSTTSFFLSRSYNFKSVGNQPLTPIGGSVPSESERLKIEGKII